MLIHVEFEEIPGAAVTNLACTINCVAQFSYLSLRHDPSARGQLTDVPTSAGDGAPFAGGSCALLIGGFSYNPAIVGVPPPDRNRQYAFEVDPPPDGTPLCFRFTVTCPVPTDWTFALRVDNAPPLAHTITFGNSPVPGAPSTTSPYGFTARLTLPNTLHVYP